MVPAAVFRKAKSKHTTSYARPAAQAVLGGTSQTSGLAAGQTAEVSLTPGGCEASAAAYTRTRWVARGRAHSSKHHERWLAGDEPHRAGDVSPGQGLPIHELQHILGNVKLRPPLTLQLLLQNQPRE